MVLALSVHRASSRGGSTRLIVLSGSSALAATCRWIVHKSHPRITPARGTAATKMPTKTTSSSMAACRSGTDAMSRLVQRHNEFS